MYADILSIPSDGTYIPFGGTYIPLAGTEILSRQSYAFFLCDWDVYSGKVVYRAFSTGKSYLRIRGGNIRKRRKFDNV